MGLYRKKNNTEVSQIAGNVDYSEINSLKQDLTQLETDLTQKQNKEWMSIFHSDNRVLSGAFTQSIENFNEILVICKDDTNIRITNIIPVKAIKNNYTYGTRFYMWTGSQPFATDFFFVSATTFSQEGRNQATMFVTDVYAR